MKINFFIITILTLLLAGGTAFAAPGDLDGPYDEHGVLSNVINSWATSVTGSSGYTNPDNILGSLDTGLAVGSGGGSITVGFDVTITNGNGDDFVVWENGFLSDYIPPGTVHPHDGVYAEFAFVSVSTDGANWATFPTAYLDNMTPFPNVDTTYVNNLAGNYIAWYGDSANWEGTGFNLDDLAGNSAVLAGLVDLDNINYVRLDDIIGAGEGGTEVDSLGNTIYDGNGWSGTGGADFNGVGVINATPIPGAVWLFGSGVVALIGIRRRKTA